MPAEHDVDPTWLDVVATQLTRSSSAALEACHELLAHYGDTGDPQAQRAVDSLVEGAADALGAISAALAETSSRVRLTAERTAEKAADDRHHNHHRDGTRRHDRRT